MIDKLFLLAYLFIILSLARVVWTSWRGADAEAEAATSHSDHVWVASLLALYFLANIGVVLSGLQAS
jgi:hypothetical protein